VTEELFQWSEICGMQTGVD